MIHRRLLQLAGAVPGTILGLAAVGIVVCALHVAFALTAATVIAALVHGAQDVGPALGVLAVVAVARAVVIGVREPLAARCGASVRIRLRRRLLEQVAAAPSDDRRSGETAATVIDGVDGLDAYYTRYLPQLIVVLLVPAAIVVIVSMHSPSAGGVLAVAATVAVVAPRFWDARLLRNGRARWTAFTQLSGDYVEALQSIPLLRSFGAAARVGAELDARAHELHRSTMVQLRVSLVESALSALAVHLGTVLAVVTALAAVASGSTTATAAVTVLLLARECFRPVADLGTHWHAGYLGLAAVDGLDRLCSLTPAVAADGTHATPAAPAAPVELHDVTFRHPGTDVGVVGLSLRVEPGEVVAVVGPSGSGKSTLARLLEREFDPDEGAIRIDDVELRDYTRGALCRSVVVVPQDPVLFAWTVRDNLRLYRPDATDAEVERAAASADLHHVIAGLPAGYDTVLAENGEQLSGGQRQRVAIARALVARAPVLVLDEATSALDTQTERRVMDAVCADDPARTTIVIAHRESAAERATRWVAMSEGRIVEAGDGPPSSRAVPVGGAR